VTRIVEWKS